MPDVLLRVDNSFHSVFRPFLQYCVPFWAMLLKRDFIELQHVQERVSKIGAYKSCHMRSSSAYLNCRNIVLSGEVTAAFKQSERLTGGERLVLSFSSEEKLWGANFG